MFVFYNYNYEANKLVYKNNYMDIIALIGFVCNTNGVEIDEQGALFVILAIKDNVGYKRFSFYLLFVPIVIAI